MIEICKECGSELNATSNYDGNEPVKVGDVLICVYCSHITIFGDDLCTREPSKEELLELFSDDKDRLSEALEMLAELRKSKLFG